MNHPIAHYVHIKRVKCLELIKIKNKFILNKYMDMYMHLKNNNYFTIKSNGKDVTDSILSNHK